MRVLVFGSRNLTAKHVPSMVKRLRKVAAMVARDDELVLVHGDGPPGKSTPGAIGADKLSEVAALIAWWGRPWKVKRHPVEQQGDETWGQAAHRRNEAMAHTAKPVLAECFHTDAKLGKGSADTAALLHREGVGYHFTHLTTKGEVVAEEERSP